MTPAQVAKLVDALVLGTSGAIHGGSSPLLGTHIYKKTYGNIGFFIYLISRFYQKDIFIIKTLYLIMGFF